VTGWQQNASCAVCLAAAACSIDHARQVRGLYQECGYRAAGIARLAAARRRAGFGVWQGHLSRLTLRGRRAAGDGYEVVAVTFRAALAGGDGGVLPLSRAVLTPISQGLIATVAISRAECVNDTPAYPCARPRLSLVCLRQAGAPTLQALPTICPRSLALPR
jgi:hypothetical protein